jgi:hypothetical protein
MKDFHEVGFKKAINHMKAGDSLSNMICVSA